LPTILQGAEEEEQQSSEVHAGADSSEALAASPEQSTPQESSTSRAESEDEPVNELTEVFSSDWTAERFSMSSELTAQRYSLSTPRPAEMLTPRLTPRSARGELPPQIREWEEDRSVSDLPKPPGVRALLRKFESSAPSTSTAAKSSNPCSPRWSSRGFNPGKGSAIKDTPKICASAAVASDTPRVRALAAHFGAQDGPRIRERARTIAVDVATPQNHSQTDATAAPDSKLRPRARTLADSSALQGPTQAKDHADDVGASGFDMRRQVSGRSRAESNDSKRSNIFSDAVNKLRTAEENRRTSLKNVFDSDWTNPASALQDDSNLTTPRRGNLDQEQPFTRQSSRSSNGSGTPRNSTRQSSDGSKVSVTRVPVTMAKTQADAASQMRAKMAKRRSRMEARDVQQSFEEAPLIKSEVVVARPRVGSTVRAKDSRRCGRIIMDDGSDLPFKVEFSDGGKPPIDWLRVDAVEVLDRES